MHKSLRAVALISAVLASTFAQDAQAQNPSVIVLESANRPLVSLQAAATLSRTETPVVLFNEIPNQHYMPDTRTQSGGGNIGADRVLQPYSLTYPINVLTQFDGADNTDNGFNITPPDTDGDVSSDAVDRYVQMINLVTTVFDKSGAVQGGGPFFSNAFWLGFGGLCESSNRGDPIVLYDESSDRWLVSQFAFTSTSVGPWFQCIAVSQTSDPLGAYNRYAFDFSTLGFPDYPKHGFVSNDITLMANLFTPGFAGTFIGAIDKTCVYAGITSCTLVGANLGGSEFGFVAADLDDPTNSAGTVGAFFATAMTASGMFDIWEVVPDYTTPANTTLSRIARIPISPFDNDLCSAFRERCVPHPGSGDNLETLSGRLMHRLQIRDFGTHLSMVASHTVDADAAPSGTAGRTGIRWYEVRSTDGGANWSLFQEGTYAPADGLHRWMPSIAMNAAGDLAVGYMVSDATNPVAIRVSGQSASQSGTGLFNAEEAVCRAGIAGSDWAGRAGDYSAMNVDPTTDSFWHTNEFGRSTASRGYGTAVCEFVFEEPAGLPVELVRFTGAEQSGGISLVWETASESNSASFEVEHLGLASCPGGYGACDPSWQVVGGAESRGGPSRGHVYSLLVSADQLEPGINRFRLLQIDLDGTAIYFDEIEVALGLEGLYQLVSLYPNPMRDDATLRLATSSAQTVRFSMYDPLGRPVREWQNELPSDRTVSIPISSSGLASGLYVLHIEGRTFRVDKPILVQR